MKRSRTVLILLALTLPLAVPESKAGPELYFADVSSAPSGSYVCAFGRDFPPEAYATVYLDTGRMCSVATFADYFQGDYASGEVEARLCFEMPAHERCRVIDSLILSNGATDSNALRLSRHAGTVYWVTTIGNDSNSCTSEAQACRSITEVQRRIGPGDAVLIRTGEYDPSSVTTDGYFVWDKSGTASKPITLRGYPGDTVILNVRRGSPNAPVERTHVQLANFAGVRQGDAAAQEESGQDDDPPPETVANCWRSDRLGADE